jgi:hypothetical protein
MARNKNSSFVGVLVDDLDRGDESFTRVINESYGDAALTYDKLTGRNAEANTINHGGTAGRGALLRVPLTNQYIGRSLNILDSSGAKDGGEGDTNIIAVPIFIPAGEIANLVVELFLTLDTGQSDRLQARVVLTDSALAEVDAQALQFQDFALGVTRAWTRINAASAGLHLLFVRFTTSIEEPSSGAPYDVPVGTLHSWSMYADVNITPSMAPPRLPSSPFSVWTPSSTQGLGWRDADAGMFANNEAYSAYLTAGLDRNLNSLIEYTTGWPAGGNAAYTHVDHDGAGSPDAVDPARSRFHAGTLTVESSEAQIEWPLMCQALGGFKTDGGLTVEAATPPTYGMLDWFAPWGTDVARQTINKARIIWPDFPTGTSRLNIAVLLGSDAAADVTDWTISVNKTAGRTTCDAPFAVSGANIYWLAVQDAVTFSPDTADTVELEIQKTTGALEAVDQMVVLGWCLYFDV